MPQSKILHTWIFVVLIASQTIEANDWPNWLGPEKDGVWREHEILDFIPESGLKKVWSSEIQGGYSGPAAADGLVYVLDFVGEEAAPTDGRLGQVSGTERVLCLDAETGEEVWKHEYSTKLKVSYPGGPRTTPFVDGDRVYAQGTMGKLLCLDAKTGEVIWEKEVAESYATRPPIWGYASHPLILDDTVFCTAGGENSGVIALDKNTGAEKWAAITAQEIGYAPLVAAELHGKMQLVVWYDVALVGLEIETGKVLWKYSFPSEKPQRPIVSIVPPKVIDNQIFITNFYHGSALVSLEHSESDGFKAKELWSTEKRKKIKGYKPEINSIMSSVLNADGCLFGIAGNGELRCVDMESSDVLWRSYQALATKGENPDELPRGFKGFASAFMTPHEENTWIFTDQGDLILAQLSRQEYKELGRSRLLEPTGSTRGREYVWCHPAYANGHIFVRNEKQIACFDLRLQSY